MRPEAKKAKDTILPIKPDESTQFYLYEDLMKAKELSEKELKDRKKVEGLIREMYGKGCRPIIAIEPSYLKILKEQRKRLRIMKKHNSKVTFGIPPEPLYPDQKALLMELPLDEIAPVYDGPDNTFIGHVYISHNYVNPELLNELRFEEEIEEPELRLVEVARETAEEVIEKKSAIKKRVEPWQFEEFKKEQYTEDDLMDEDFVNSLVDEMYEKGIRPVVSVDEKTFNEAIEIGLMPEVQKAGFIHDQKSMEVYATKILEKLKGSLGRPPTAHKGKRLFLLNVRRNRIKPTLGGPKTMFNGAVDIVGGPVIPEYLEEIEFKKPELKVVSDREGLEDDARSGRPQPSV